MLIEHHIEDRAHARLCDGRDVVAVLTQEARRLAKGVNELRDATGGRHGEHLPVRVRIGRVLVSDRPTLLLEHHLRRPVRRRLLIFRKRAR